MTRTSLSDARLAARFDALGRFEQQVAGHLPDPPPATVDQDALARAHTLVERATARLRLCERDEGAHTVVALAGATGVGKSSLFNALARMDLSPAGHLRPTTGRVHACVWHAQGADPLLDWLGVAPEHRFVRESVLDGAAEAPLRGLVLLDLPDMDSVATGHRVEADRVVAIVDLVIWVLDPQKYADRRVHEEYLRHMGALREVTVVVFNQADRLSAADAARCTADLGRLVEADGLSGVPVITTSAVTDEGVGELRALLEKTVAGRSTAVARLAGELDAAVASVAPLVTGEPVDDDLVVRQAVPQLADEFGTAVGAGGVAAAASAAYRARARVPGWPRRRRATSVTVPPADPSAVGRAVRQLAARTSAGLPAPWPDEIRAAAGTRLDRLPDDLARVLTAALSRPPGMAGWRLARAVWWIAVTAALGGIGWLVWAGVADASPPALGRIAVGRIAVPLVLAAAGLAVAVLLPPAAGALGRAASRRHRRIIEGRLHAATLTVAREVVAPVRAVLRDYAAALRDHAAARSEVGAVAGPGAGPATASSTVSPSESTRWP